MTSPAVILWNPVLPPVIMLLCGIVFAWLAWRTYRDCRIERRKRLLFWSLRMAAFLILCFILAQPSRRDTRRESEKPALAVLVDISASMDDNPTRAPQTRAVRAASFLRSKTIKEAEKDFRVLYFAVGNDLEEGFDPSSDLSFHAPRTFLLNALQRLNARLRAENLAGIILLSDGLDQSMLDLDSLAFTAPLLIPELEDPAPIADSEQSDFAITDLAYPKRVIVKWDTRIELSVQRKTGSGGAAFPVHLRQNGEIIKSEQVEFADNERFRKVAFTITPEQIGSQLYEVAIEPENDQDSSNNRKELLIEVTDAKQRVLYLEGVPRWEFKFLKRALLAEKSYQLNAFVQGGDGAFINFDEQSGLAGGALPTLNAENLKAYKAIIIGDMPGSAIDADAAKQIQDFVDKGGGLLIIGAARAYGRDGFISNEHIQAMMPAKSAPDATMREGRFMVDFTAAGRAVPALASLADEMRLPPILSLWAPVETGAFTTVVLTSSDNTPVLVTRRFGQGRVAMLLSDSLWRWQMGSGGDNGGKGIYGRFVTQLLTWLCPSQDERDDSGLMQILLADGEVDLRARMVIGLGGLKQSGVSSVTCRIRTPGDKELAIPMAPARLESEVGLSQPTDGFRCDFVPDEVGPYRVSVTSPDGTQEAGTVFLARFPEHERSGQPANRSLLQRLASMSNGNYLPWAEQQDLLAKLDRTPREIESASEYPIWNHWLALAALITLFCLEWWLRRRADMV
ncbi:MAG: hypothetical protein GX945_06455 [Lentisphaerae bacterium]|nr:hypothetical protein [Lentisphaerota bacterium]